MIIRNRGYYREMRNNHIRRKKKIDKEIHQNLSTWYPCNGMYSKGKIHCSCFLCSGKDFRGRHIKTLQERKIENDIKDYIKYLS